MSQTGTVPDPAQFDDFHGWLRAALEATGQSMSGVSRAIGASKSTVRNCLTQGYLPERPTMRKLAEHFGVSPIEILAFSSKNPLRVAGGLRGWAQMDDDKRQNVLNAQRPINLSREDRVANGKLGMAVRRRRHGYDALVVQAARARIGLRRAVAARGSQFKSPESLQRRIENWRAAGPHDGGWTKRHAYYEQHPEALQRLRERMSQHMTLTQITLKVRRSPEGKLRDNLLEQAKTMRKHLRNPKHRGSPPKLLEHAQIAVAAAILSDEYGYTTTQIGKLAGWDTQYRDARKNKAAHRWAWEMVRFGRVLLGTTDQPEDEADVSA